MIKSTEESDKTGESSIFTEEELLLIKHVLKKRNWHTKIAKDSHLGTLSLLDHSLKVYHIASELLNFFVTLTDIFIKISEEEKRALGLAALLHDSGKETDMWQSYILKISNLRKQGKTRYIRSPGHVSIDPINEVLEDIIYSNIVDINKQLSVLNSVEKDIISYSEFEDLLSNFSEIKNDIIKQGILHDTRSRNDPNKIIDLLTLEEGSKLDKWRQLGWIVTFADLLASIDTPEACKRILTIPGFGQLSRMIELHYHKIAFIRGITSQLLHSSVEKTYREKKWYPIVYFSIGTIYINRKGSELPSIKEIKNASAGIFKEFLNQYKSNIPELFIGIPNNMMIASPKFFTKELLSDYFELSMDKINEKNYKSNDEAVINYSIAKKIQQEHNWIQGLEYLNDRKKYEKKYGKLIVSPSKEQLREIASLMSEIRIELVLLKFFKALFSEFFITKVIKEKVTKMYNKEFGKGTFEKLIRTSTLNLARDLYCSWIPIKEWKTTEHEVYKTLPAKERRKLLRKKLLAISTDIFQEESIQSPLITDFQDIIKTDLIEPNINLPKEITELCKYTLKKYSKARTLYGSSSKSEIFQCTVCNICFEGSNTVSSKLTSFSKKYCNKYNATKNFGTGISICKFCELEYSLRYLVLGRKAEELIIFYPRYSSSRHEGINYQNLFKRFQKDIYEYAGLNATKYEHFITFRDTSSIIKLVINNISSLNDLLNTQTDLAELFLHKRSEISRNKVQKNVKKAMNKLSIKVEDFGYKKEKDFITGLLEGQTNIPSFIRRRILARVPQNLPEIQFCYQTPNFIVAPLLYPLGGRLDSKEDSDVNLTLKALLVSSILGLLTNSSIAILKDNDQIPEQAKGLVRVPTNQHLLTLTNRPWLDYDEALFWTKKIAIGTILARRAKYPERNNIYSVFKENKKGKLLRRIEIKNDFISMNDINFLIEFFGEI